MSGIQNMPAAELSWSPVCTAGIIFALGKIDLLLALFAVVLAIEFIREDFDLCAAMVACAHKGFQVSQRFKAGAMCRSSHCVFSLLYC